MIHFKIKNIHDKDILFIDAFDSSIMSKKFKFEGADVFDNQFMFLNMEIDFNSVIEKINIKDEIKVTFDGLTHLSGVYKVNIISVMPIKNEWFTKLTLERELGVEMAVPDAKPFNKIKVAYKMEAVLWE